MADIAFSFMLPCVIAVYLCVNSGGLTPVLGLTVLTAPSSWPLVLMKVAKSSTLLEGKQSRIKHHMMMYVG